MEKPINCKVSIYPDDLAALRRIVTHGWTGCKIFVCQSIIADIIRQIDKSKRNKKCRQRSTN